MDTHLYITLVERFFSTSLTCAMLPTVYPGCTNFWLGLYFSALLLLSIVCFYAMWDLSKQLLRQREHE